MAKDIREVCTNAAVLMTHVTDGTAQAHFMATMFACARILADHDGTRKNMEDAINVAERTIRDLIDEGAITLPKESRRERYEAAGIKEKIH